MTLAHELEELLVKINLANTVALLDDGRTITAALACRDRLALQHATILKAIAATKPSTDRYSSRELRWVAVLPVAALQEQAEGIARELRELNMKIQQANWQHELP